MKKSILALLIILILAFFVFTACQEEGGLSIDDRIKEFVKDVNNNRNNACKNNFHPLSGFRNGDSNTVTTLGFPSGPTYSVGSISGSGKSRTVVINGVAPITRTFTMLEDGKDNWYIMTIY